MTANPGPDPSAFHYEGGPIGCLLVHGFTGAPPEMRPLGEYLAGKGIAVSAPLLPGHGATAGRLNRVRWEDWLCAAQVELVALRERCQAVFVAGLSMGALLCTHLAIMYPDVAGQILYSPALAVANKFLPLARFVYPLIKQFPTKPDTDLTDPDAPARLWHYRTYPVHGAAEFHELQRVVRAELKDARAPAIVFHSTRDGTLDPASAQLTFDGLGAADKELVTLHNSGHCLTVDTERESVFARTYGFIVAHSGGRI